MSLVETGTPPGARGRPALRWTVALALAFLFRLGFGLTSDFWTEDERQIYLIGLRAYARGEWPYFGPDVVWTQSRIPGALQGILVGAPFRVLPIPEAPFLLLNALSFGALCLLAWYTTRRLPELPAPIVWAWLLTTPWTLHFSTHLVNTSYILPGAVVFFVGFFEACPPLARGLIPRSLAWFMMGVALLWMVQIHMSWVLLPPYAAAALLLSARRDAKGGLKDLAALTLGAAVAAATLAPTVWRFGLAATGGLLRNLELHALGPWTFVTILARLLSFPGFELNRFLGLSTARRLVLLAQHPWLIPLVLSLGVVGFLQPLALAGSWLRRRAPWPEWRALKLLLLLTAAWIYVSYFFSVKEPLAHAFYVTFPIVALYAAHAAAFVRWTPRARRWAASLIVAGVVLHAGFAAAVGPERSLYRRRWLVQQAIDGREDRLLGERRITPWLPAELRDGAPPAAFEGALGSARPWSDLEITRQSWARAAIGRASRFQVKVRNRSGSLAYLDLRYVTRYWDAQDRPHGSGLGVIKDILQPGEARRYQVVDGLAKPGAARGELEMVGAEPVLPAVELRRPSR